MIPQIIIPQIRREKFFSVPLSSSVDRRPLLDIGAPQTSPHRSVLRCLNPHGALPMTEVGKAPVSIGMATSPMALDHYLVYYSAMCTVCGTPNKTAEMENNEVSHAARERLPRYWNIDNDWETWMQTVYYYVKLEFVNIKKEMQRLYFQPIFTYDTDTFNNILARMRVLKRKLKSITVWKLLIRQKVQITRSVSFDEGLDNYCRGKEI